MNRISFRVLMVVLSSTLLCLPACKKNKTKLTNNNTVSEPLWIKDPHSFSRPEEAVVTQLDIKLDISFASKLINGTASWNYQASDSAKFIYFDVKNIEVVSVTDGDSTNLTYELGNYDPVLGQPLKVDISTHPRLIEIHYHTTDSSDALQWLNPSQTAGKKYPFLYTQSEATLCRT